MNVFTRSVLLVAALGSLALPTLRMARADVGPRPPITDREVTDPENYLAMRDETVNVTIDPNHVAHVDARFHFAQVQAAYRQTLRMRIGFPELHADAPLRDFHVAQAVYFKGGQPGNLDPVTDIVVQGRGTGPTAAIDAKWKTWPLVFFGHNGAPTSSDVATRVSYTQALTRLKNGHWQYTYVLRSGAPWRDAIGRADIKVTAPGHIISATPAGATIAGNTATWTMKEFEPTQDVVVVVR